MPDAAFDVVSVLEEHRSQFPGLIIESAPRRFYPDGALVAPFVGYIGEISENELTKLTNEDYKAGQQIGKQGLEKQYEAELRGKEGSQFVEVDARGRIVRQEGARADLQPVAGPPLYTNIDMDLQRVAASVFGDTLQGGVIAMEPKTGAVLALYSAPSWDANRFVGGIPAQYWDSLRADPRNPLYNKVAPGRVPARVHLQARHGRHCAGNRRGDDERPHADHVHRRTAVRLPLLPLRRACTAASRSPARSPSRATSTSTSSASSSA